jgi:hypothetical protein
MKRLYNMIAFLKKLFGKNSGCCKIPNTNDGLKNDTQASCAPQKAYNPK